MHGAKQPISRDWIGIIQGSSVLQCVAVCCSVVRCSVLQCVAVCCISRDWVGITQGSWLPAEHNCIELALCHVTHSYGTCFIHLGRDSFIWDVTHCVSRSCTVSHDSFIWDMTHSHGTRLAEGIWLLAEQDCVVTVLLALCHFTH